MRALILVAVLAAPSLAAADDADPTPNWAEKRAPVSYARGYGDAGVVEAGASAGVMLASHLAETISPSVGWFLGDNVELSAILAVTHVHDGSRSSTFGTALLEPSIHRPLTATVYGFAGLGFGLGYVAKVGMGLAIAPRVGVNVRAFGGMITPALSLEYMTHGIDSTTLNPQMDASSPEVPNALRLSVGYSSIF